MKRKFSMIFVAVFVCMAVISHVLAVTYEPNKNDNIVKDNVATLDKVYTQEDVDNVLKIYISNRDVTEEELKMYDFNDDNVINSVDAALILNYINQQ